MYIPTDGNGRAITEYRIAIKNAKQRSGPDGPGEIIKTDPIVQTNWREREAIIDRDGGTEGGAETSGGITGIKNRISN